MRALTTPQVAADNTSTEDVAGSATAREQGEVLLDLMLQPQWIHRRVERLVIEDTGECTRYVSLDFTVPNWCRIPGSSDDRVLVPLGVVRKGALRGFDVRGASDKPVPFLGKSDNGELAIQMLVAAAREHQPAGPALQEFEKLVSRAVYSAADAEAVADADDAPPTPEELYTAVSNIVTRVVEGTDTAIAPTEHEKIALLRNDLASLVTKYIHGFLMVIEVDADVLGRRSIIKFSFREPVYNWDRKETVWQINDFVMAESTHFELSPPALLKVTEAELVGSAVSGEQCVLDSHPEPHSKEHSTLHLVGSAGQDYLSAVVVAKLAPRSFGAYAAAFWGPLALVLTFIAGILVRTLRTEMEVPTERLSTGLPTLMLTAGGLLLTWVARTPEDWTTARILRPARRVLSSAASLCAATAAFLALPFGDPWRTYGWLTGLLLAHALLAVAWFVHGRHHVGRSLAVFSVLVIVSLGVTGYALGWDFSLFSDVARAGSTWFCRSGLR